MIIRLINEGKLPLRGVLFFTKKLRDDLRLQKDIYVEVWDRKSFENHFEFCKKNPLIYDHALDQMKPVQGLYNPKTENQYYKGCYHNIAIVDDNHWMRTLCHEMIHAQQCEIMGINMWNQLGDIFVGQRKEDPIEAHASFMGDRIFKSWNGLV